MVTAYWVDDELPVPLVPEELPFFDLVLSLVELEPVPDDAPELDDGLSVVAPEVPLEPDVLGLVADEPEPVSELPEPIDEPELPEPMDEPELPEPMDEPELPDEPDEVSLDPEEPEDMPPEEPVDEVPLPPDDMSLELLPLVLGELIVDDGEVVLLPVPVAPLPCASAMDETDATTTNESDFRVVFKVMTTSFSIGFHGSGEPVSFDTASLFRRGKRRERNGLCNGHPWMQSPREKHHRCSRLDAASLRMFSRRRQGRLESLASD